ncbi:MAG: PQQ-dependent sugar dehydrogenase [Alphaproteobacteria bacterium]
MRLLAIILLALFLNAPVFAAYEESSAQYDFELVPVVGDLEYPWGMDFLPGGDVLITEKSGNLILVRMPSGEKQSVSGLPDIAEIGQGGLLDVLIHPDFQSNQTIFLSYAGRSERGYGTEVVRAKLNGPRLTEVTKIFEAVPKVRGRVHFGSRLLWGPDDKLYITLGDRGRKEEAQDPKNHLGSVIRINPDGTIPEDNPFVNDGRKRPEIFTYGNRNVQGIAMHPETKEIWAHEHGPKGGDEINILKAGNNYGWPEITYGVAYSGFPITDQTSAPGMEQPVLYWDPSIAPCGMIFYTGNKFPAWQGNIFVGALAGTHLRRISIDGTEVIEQEVLLEEFGERIRDVANGPDGFIYILTDKLDGQLLRLEPKK